MEHFGALAALALRETKDPNYCANQSVERQTSLLFSPIHLVGHRSAKCAKMQLGPLKHQRATLHYN